MKKTLILIISIILLSIIVILYFIYFNYENKSNLIQQVNDNLQNIDKLTIENSISDKDKQILEGINNSHKATSNQTDANLQIKYYTLDEIKQHNNKASCWTIINNMVYDLTNWIDSHPGGAKAILRLCGKEGTQAFIKKHGGEEKPEKVLEKFKIGILKIK